MVASVSRGLRFLTKRQGLRFVFPDLLPLTPDPPSADTRVVRLKKIILYVLNTLAYIERGNPAIRNNT